MKIYKLLTALTLVFLCGLAAVAATKEEKQAEARKKAEDTLQSSTRQNHLRKLLSNRRQDMPSAIVAAQRFLWPAPGVVVASQ